MHIYIYIYIHTYTYTISSAHSASEPRLITAIWTCRLSNNRELVYIHNNTIAIRA